MTLQEKFNFLEDLLLNKREAIGVHTGVPFIMLIYEPKREAECKNEIEALKEKLVSRNLRVDEIPLNRFIFDQLEEGQLKEIFEHEKEAPDEVREELSKRCKFHLKQYVLDKIKSGKPDIVFLTDVASLHPYYRVSNLLYSLENEVRMPFIVFYPGEERDGKLFFLGEYESSGYYRALRI